jgi:hypothetical protein
LGRKRLQRRREAPPAGTRFPAPNLNNVVLTVETNSHVQLGGVSSGTFYNISRS